MEKVELKISDILKMGEKVYRVIFIRAELCVLCEMGISKLNLICLDSQEVSNGLMENEYILEYQSEKTVIDKEKLTETQRKKYEKKIEFIRRVEKEFGPTYLALQEHRKKDGLLQIITELQIPKNSAWRYIRTYLQSGMDENSLYPNYQKTSHSQPYQYKNKPGAKNLSENNMGVVLNDEHRNNFFEALNYLKSGRTKTIRDAYDWMNVKFYSTTTIINGGALQISLLPVSERPTEKQFRYFVEKHLSQEEKDKIKTSAQEQRNNRRLLLSDNLAKIAGPGDCVEMDEVEVDVSLISSINPNQTVGRPIVYIMLDVYTRAIVSVSVTYDNNSVRGLTNCFLGLLDDRKMMLSDGQPNLNIWPSGFLPRRIRTDRGSEYRSKEIKRIFNELNITLEIVPGGMGSLKGSVEQFFHQMHTAQNPLLEHNGLIQKRFDSKHHEEATLTIDEFKQILYNYIVSYNQMYMKNYPLTKEMISKQVRPIPMELWRYGIEKYGEPRPISNREQFLYTLMLPVSATISRKGICYKGLYYMDFSDVRLQKKMYSAGNSHLPIETRIDVRDVGRLYYLDDNQHLKVLPLNTERTGNDYQGMPLAEYLELYKAKKEQDRQGSILNDQLRVERLAKNMAVMEKAQNRPCPSTTQMREARAIEKMVEASKLSISHDEESTLLEANSKSMPIKSNVDALQLKQHEEAPKTFDEALDRFWEEN